MTVAIGSVAQARSAIAAAIDYTRNRKAFGTPVASFQNTKFELAACSTEVEAAQAMLDRAVALHVEGELPLVRVGAGLEDAAREDEEENEEEHAADHDVDPVELHLELAAPFGGCVVAILIFLAMRRIFSPAVHLTHLRDFCGLT